MFLIRAVVASGVFSMILTTAMTAHAQPRHHAKDAETDTEADAEADADAPRAKNRSRQKARGKSRAKAKAVETDADADADGDADAPRSKSRSKTRSKTKVKATETEEADASADAERERAAAAERDAAKQRARDQEEADAAAAVAAARAKETAAATAAEATSGGGGGGEAYHHGTLGFSIPFAAVSDGAGGVAAEPVSTVDIVYFLDDKSALDLIVGINVHRKHAAAAMGGTSDSTLIGAAAGLGYRMYSASNGLRSYLEPQAVISWPDTSSTDSLGVNLGGAMGLERNVTPWFSVSGEVGVALNFASKFQDIRLATAARLAANLYWQ
jgi:hypothetical protein